MLTGAVWFFGSLAFFAIAQAIEATGGVIDVPEPVGFLIYLGPWCAGPLLMLVGAKLSGLASIFDRH
jgi:hypothetical protein